MQNIKEFIENNISNIVLSSDNTTRYRSPLIAFADACDDRFNLLKKLPTLDTLHLMIYLQMQKPL